MHTERNNEPLYQVPVKTPHPFHHISKFDLASDVGSNALGRFSIPAHLHRRLLTKSRKKPSLPTQQSSRTHSVSTFRQCKYSQQDTHDVHTFTIPTSALIETVLLDTQKESILAKMPSLVFITKFIMLKKLPSQQRSAYAVTANHSFSLLTIFPHRFSPSQAIPRLALFDSAFLRFTTDDFDDDKISPVFL